MTRVVLLLLLFTNLLFSCALCGYGASFVDVSTNTVIDGSSLKKIEVLWKFDEIASNTITLGFDKNKNGIFDQLETGNIYDAMSKSVKPSFMSVVSINGSNKFPYKIENFKATLKNKVVYFYFEITLNYPLKEKNFLEYYFLDTTGALAFFHVVENTNFKNNSKFKVKKNFGFKAVQKSMSVVNVVSFEISR